MGVNNIQRLLLGLLIVFSVLLIAPCVFSESNEYELNAGTFVEDKVSINSTKYLGFRITGDIKSVLVLGDRDISVGEETSIIPYTIMGLDEGTYSGVLDLRYEEGRKEVNLTVNVLPAISDSPNKSKFQIFVTNLTKEGAKHNIHFDFSTNTFIEETELTDILITIRGDFYSQDKLIRFPLSGSQVFHESMLIQNFTSGKFYIVASLDGEEVAKQRFDLRELLNPPPKQAMIQPIVVDELEEDIQEQLSDAAEVSEEQEVLQDIKDSTVDIPELDVVDDQTLNSDSAVLDEDGLDDSVDVYVEQDTNLVDQQQSDFEQESVEPVLESPDASVEVGEMFLKSKQPLGIGILIIVVACMSLFFSMVRIVKHEHFMALKLERRLKKAVILAEKGSYEKAKELYHDIQNRYKQTTKGAKHLFYTNNSRSLEKLSKTFNNKTDGESKK